MPQSTHCLYLIGINLFAKIYQNILYGHYTFMASVCLGQEKKWYLAIPLARSCQYTQNCICIKTVHIVEDLWRSIYFFGLGVVSVMIKWLMASPLVGSCIGISLFCKNNNKKKKNNKKTTTTKHQVFLTVQELCPFPFILVTVGPKNNGMDGQTLITGHTPEVDRSYTVCVTSSFRRD